MTSRTGRLIEHICIARVIRHNPRFAVGGPHRLVTAKTPSYTGWRKSSTVRSLFTVCGPERAMLGPARAANFLSWAPTGRACAVGITNLHTSSVLYRYRGTAQSLDLPQHVRRGRSSSTKRSHRELRGPYRRFTVRARSRPRWANTLVSFPSLESD